MGLTLVALIAATGCGSVALLSAPRDDGGINDGGDGSIRVDGSGFEARDGELGTRGSPCGADTECEAGFCADGVCCNVACRGACASCDQPGRVGVCWPVGVGQQDPRRLCVDEGSASCGNTGTCDGVGRCAQYELGTACAGSTCSAGVLHGARVCDGRGTCGPAPAPRACAPYACSSALCWDTCFSDAGCAAPATCVSGSCRNVPALVLSSPSASGEIGGAYADAPIDDLCPAHSVVVGYDVATSGEPGSDVVVRIRTVCAPLRIAHSSPLAVELGATTSLPERGSGAGPSTPLRCPANQIVYGFDGRSGAFVDQLSFRCAPLLISNTETTAAIGAVTTLAPVGGNGGSAHPTTDCGPTQVAVGTRTLDDAVLKRLALLCASVSLQ